jgi:hypothetical protein
MLSGNRARLRACYLTLIHDGRIVRTGTKEEILEAYRVVRGGPEDLCESAGVQLIGVRRTSTGAQALVRAEEAGLLGGDVEAPTLDELPSTSEPASPGGIQTHRRRHRP